MSTFIRRVVKSGDTGGFNGVSICSSTNIRTSLVHFSRSLHHLFGNPKVEHLVVDPQLLGSKKSPIFDDQPVDFKGIQQKLDSHPRHRSRFAGDFRSLQHFFGQRLRGALLRRSYPRSNTVLSVTSAKILDQVIEI